MPHHAPKPGAGDTRPRKSCIADGGYVTPPTSELPPKPPRPTRPPPAPRRRTGKFFTDLAQLKKAARS
jgi:hypothetical protein